MNQVSTVTSLRQRAAVNAVAPHPQVFTEELVGRLGALNKQVRWLRAHNHATLSVNVRGVRPTLVVSATAAALLIGAGHGKTTIHRIGSEPIHSVVIDGCKFEWQGQEAV